MSQEAILVTGGAGYVGSHTVASLLSEGGIGAAQIVVVDNMCNAQRTADGLGAESLRRVEKITGKKINFYDIDLREKKSLQKVFQKYKVQSVIHFAALKAVGESVQIPLDYYQTNITGTCVLLQVMKEFGVKRLVYSSSCTVYGEPQHLPLDEKHPTGLGLTSPYGKSKYFCEEIMKDLCYSDQDWTIISLRYFNPVGAHESGDIGEDPTGIPNNLMPYISQVAVGRRAKLQVFGSDYDTPDGTGVRDYVHVQDLAAGHACALALFSAPQDNRGFITINLGTGKGYSVLEVVKAFEVASGRAVPYEIVDRRAGDTATVYADANLAKNLLGWTAVRGLDEMCRDTWRWQSKNPNGFAAK